MPNNKQNIIFVKVTQMLMQHTQTISNSLFDLAAKLGLYGFTNRKLFASKPADGKS